MKKKVSQLIFLVLLSIFFQAPTTSVYADPGTTRTIGGVCLSAGTVASVLGGSLVLEALLEWRGLKKLKAQGKISDDTYKKRVASLKKRLWVAGGVGVAGLVGLGVGAGCVWVSGQQVSHKETIRSLRRAWSEQRVQQIIEEEEIDVNERQDDGSSLLAAAFKGCNDSLPLFYPGNQPDHGPLVEGLLKKNATLTPKEASQEWAADILSREAGRLDRPGAFPVAAPGANPMQVNPRVREFVVKAGFDIDARGTKGFSTLHEAAMRQNPEMIKELLRLNADPDLETQGCQDPGMNGQTALQLALACETGDEGLNYYGVHGMYLPPATRGCKAVVDELLHVSAGTDINKRVENPNSRFYGCPLFLIPFNRQEDGRYNWNFDRRRVFDNDEREKICEAILAGTPDALLEIGDDSIDASDTNEIDRRIERCDRILAALPDPDVEIYNLSSRFNRWSLDGIMAECTADRHRLDRDFAARATPVIEVMRHKREKTEEIREYLVKMKWGEDRDTRIAWYLENFGDDYYGNASAKFEVEGLDAPDPTLVFRSFRGLE